VTQVGAKAAFVIPEKGIHDYVDAPDACVACGASDYRIKRGVGTDAVAGGRQSFHHRLEDGAKVKNPFLVQFGLSGTGVAPAGMEKPNTVHHHLLIDTT